jgi:predicted anti-sigma-YlaC factor YlaD
VAAHLVRCPDCRADVESFAELATLLLQVIPGSEPPLGFDRKVLAHTRPPHRRVLLAVVATGSIAAALLAVIGLAVTGSHQPGGLVAYLRHGSTVVGTFTSGGRPTWVSMTVRGLGESGLVTCQLMSRDGAPVTLGTFDLVHGSGSWSAPEPAGLAQDAGVRLVDPQGQVLASATI